MDNNFNDNYGMPSSTFSVPSLEVQAENVLLGTVGAVLGALAGAVCIVLLQKIGYYASFCGVIMAFLSLMLYGKFAGRLSVKGIIICCVVMIVTVFVTEWLYFSYEYYDIYRKRYSRINFMYYVKKLWSIMEDNQFTGKFISNLLMLYAFTALGAIPKIKQFAMEGSAKAVTPGTAGFYKPTSEVVTEEAYDRDDNDAEASDNDSFKI